MICLDKAENFEIVEEHQLSCFSYQKAPIYYTKSA